MENNIFDKEYYVLSIDEKEALLQVKFYFYNVELPKYFKKPDLFYYDDCFFGSDKFKKFIEKENIFGINYHKIKLLTIRGIIENIYEIIFNNSLSALDKNNYIGDKMNKKRKFLSIEQFSLNMKFLENIPFNKRILFTLKENEDIILVHEELVKKLRQERVNGIKYIRVDKWYEPIFYK